MRPLAHGLPLKLGSMGWGSCLSYLLCEVLGTGERKRREGDWWMWPGETGPGPGWTEQSEGWGPRPWLWVGGHGWGVQGLKWPRLWTDDALTSSTGCRPYPYPVTEGSPQPCRVTDLRGYCPTPTQ